MTLKKKREKNTPQLPLFSGLRRQIKVETRARRHGDDSGAFGRFHILVRKCEFELPEASSSAEDFDSHRAVFSGEAASFAATLLFTCWTTKQD